MEGKLKDLHRKFDHGKMDALLDALALCREHSIAVPNWIIDSLLAKRDSIVVALKPPPQRIETTGFDMTLWGGLDADRGLEQVPEGKGGRILGGRKKAEMQRAHLPNNVVLATYAQVVKGGVPRARAVTATCAKVRSNGIKISRSQVARILDGIHRRVR